jgi:Papain family cysteine protease
MKKSALFLSSCLAFFTLLAQPAVIDYRSSQSPVKNQGGRNTCSGFAVAACLETFAGVPSDLSEQHIYAGLKMLEYQSADPVDKGGRVNLYPQTLSKYGVLQESQMPYNPKQLGFSDTDHNLVQVIRESQSGPVSMLLNREKVKFYVDSADCEVAEFDAGLEISNIKRLLQQGVKAISIGYYVNSYWFNWEQKRGLVITPDSVGGFMDSSRNITSFIDLSAKYGDTVFNTIDSYFDPVGNKPWRYVTNVEAQGHAITIVGYNRDGFIIKNSWGKSWGDKGYATVSYDYHRLFAKRMLAVKKLSFNKQPSVPLGNFTDMRLKLIPQQNGGFSVSVYCADEKTNPIISMVEYKLYEVSNGIKKLRDSKLVLADIMATEYNNSFETILSQGPAGLQLAQKPGSTLQLEVSFSGAKKIKRTYKNIRLINSDYKAALL